MGDKQTKTNRRCGKQTQPHTQAWNSTPFALPLLVMGQRPKKCNLHASSARLNCLHVSSSARLNCIIRARQGGTKHRFLACNTRGTSMHINQWDGSLSESSSCRTPQNKNDYPKKGNQLCTECFVSPPFAAASCRRLSLPRHFHSERARWAWQLARLDLRMSRDVALEHTTIPW